LRACGASVYWRVLEIREKFRLFWATFTVRISCIGAKMKSFSRRDVLKSSLLAPAIAVAAHDLSPMAAAMEVAALDPDPQSQSAPSQSTYPSAGRERLLLDFGWRFHFGHADDPTKDFGFGSGRSGNFQKTGNFLPAGSTAFDDGDWQAIDLPHDWAIELPFKNDPALASKG
jgi:beta-galactosidase